ncbi:AAA-like domain-containing protein [Chlorogloea sp. CCALA 695]|uniref:WD40 domain-containing protein n=1 Tax=Chlorogloea sp. CCALA 695 TaxID=2107693 RepID=UPI000D07F349|nr:AAA-like domain-containing protein [Chlorogloea sp. CCALA 695]PSB26362.1 hypothetical protein C7B70_23980 [Chlorogloea sp. CCALA 695]
MTFDNYYKVGGSLKHNHLTYVFRKADQEIFETLKAREYCFVFNSRQMGKSSLRVQTMRKLKESGVKCTSIDLTLLGSNVSQTQWYRGIIYHLLSTFELDDQINFEVWYEQQRSQTDVQRLDCLIESILLKKFCQDIVIFIDEIDSLLQVSFKDDFFTFIRACYNKRADNVEYNRLTFCLLGVAAPADLMEDKQRTPFNISRSIELTGLTFDEAKDALIPGLKVENPEDVLQQVLTWTGGQPFLTQKLCSLIVQKAQSSQPNVSQLVRQDVIQDWESLDEPEHLRTIRDRLLSNEYRAIRLLGLYQQVLNALDTVSEENGSTAREVAIDVSDEQTLRLSGLVVKKGGYLKPYNPIYQAVFNQDWVNQQLNKLRPYSEAINGWLNHQRADSWLLQGKAFDDAQIWAVGKSLSDLDYQFFDASRKIILEQERTERSAQVKANQILAEANQKARQIIRAGSAIAFIVVVISIIYARQQLKTAEEAREGTRLTQVGDNALRQFESRQLEALLLSMQAGQDLQKLVKNERSLAKYQTIVPLSALLNILANIRQKNQLESQQEKLHDVSFSPDGKMIASGSEDGTIKRWKRDGTSLAPLSGHEGAVTSISFSPDGKMIASGSEDGTVKLWKPDGTAITFKHKNAVTSVSFSPDGNTIASGSKDRTVKLWQLERKVDSPSFEHSSSVTGISFSPDGNIIAAGTENETIELWQRDGTSILTRQAHQGLVTSVRFSPNGKILASASEDETIKLWQRKGTVYATTLNLQSPVTSISFSPDGETIAIGSLEQTVKLWNPKQDPKLLTNLTEQMGQVNSVSFSPDGKTIATANDTGTVKLWNLNQDINPLTSLTGHTGKTFNGVNFSKDSQIIATATDDGNVKLWRRDGTSIHKFFGQTNFAASFSFSPDGEMIALGTNEGTVKLWKRDGKTLIATLVMKQNRGWATSMSFSPDGEKIAVGSEQGTIELWQQNGTKTNSFFAHKKQVNSISFSPDGQTLASGSDDRTVKLWKLDGTPVTSLLTKHSKTVTSVSFSPDGQILASGSNDKTVKLWKLDGTSIATATLTGHSSAVTSVSFSPDGEILASASTDGSVMLWSLNLDDLLGRGCTWLKDYFVTYPKTLNKLTVCNLKQPLFQNYFDKTGKW